jgi:hypothetical protein
LISSGGGGNKVLFQSFDGCSHYVIIINILFYYKSTEDYTRNVRMWDSKVQKRIFYNVLNELLQKMKKGRFVFLFSRPTDKHLCLFVA